MRERIIYKNPDGSVAVLVPASNSGLTVAQIAAKDVPFGRPYKVVDQDDLPPRADRAQWDVSDADLTDGIGADYGARSENEVVGWSDSGVPVVRRRAAAPAQPPAAPRGASIIRVRA